MHSIINSSLDIFKNVGGASSQNDGRKLAVSGISSEDDHLFRGDLLHSDVIRSTSFIRGGGFKFRKNGGSDRSGNSSHLEFAHDPDSHDFIFVQEV